MKRFSLACSRLLNASAEAVPPDLVAPVSPSAARTEAIVKDLWKVVVLTLASLTICVRSMAAAGNQESVSAVALGFQVAGLTSQV